MGSSGSFSARESHTLVLDSVTGVGYVVAGAFYTGTDDALDAIYEDVWSIGFREVSFWPTMNPTLEPSTIAPTNIVVGHWTLVASTGMNPRQQHASVIDSAKGQIYTIGGWAGNGTIHLYNDVWIFDTMSGNSTSKHLVTSLILVNLLIYLFMYLLTNILQLLLPIRLQPHGVWQVLLEPHSQLEENTRLYLALARASSTRLAVQVHRSSATCGNLALAVACGPPSHSRAPVFLVPGKVTAP